MSAPFYEKHDYDRLVPIPESGNPEPYRSDFRRDYARVLHSPAFRRLQRKTQLFPGDESDFFRNRLTHSLEVAQIAKSIAIRLNYQIQQEKGPGAGGIDVDLVELAGLAHDLGHPPFGHTGEHALHECMHEVGGFEGNAQTLRILTKLEKRQTLGSSARGPDFTEFASGNDQRAGLNLCYRSLAAILKYDNCIPLIGEKSLVKGYYKSEQGLVAKIKKAVLGEKYRDRSADSLRVIEMQIMDLADDIAYSTYDFEDALKAGFGSPLDLLQQLNNNNELRSAVGRKLFKSELGREYPSANPSEEDSHRFEEIQHRMLLSIVDMLNSFFLQIDNTFSSAERRDFGSRNVDFRTRIIASIAVTMQKLSDQISRNGYVRALLTSDMIGKKLRAISIVVDDEYPPYQRCIFQTILVSRSTFLSILPLNYT
jgi:dGTPase